LLKRLSNYTKSTERSTIDGGDFCLLLCSPSALSGINPSSVIPVNKMARLQGQNVRKRGRGGGEEENVTAQGTCGGMSIWDSVLWPQYK
jgi:hypothetical protein